MTTHPDRDTAQCGRRHPGPCSLVSGVCFQPESPNPTDRDTAATLTEAERETLRDACNISQHHELTMNVTAVVNRILAARLAAQPPQDDPQPDEREALARLLCAAEVQPEGHDPAVEFVAQRQAYESLADAVLAAGFTRHPDTGLREAQANAWDEGWQAGMGDQFRRDIEPDYETDNPYRAALAEPTPGAKS